jgi:hypothetical protein
MSRRWTIAELSRLRQLAAAGADPRHIAGALDRSLLAVRIKAAHLRIALTGSYERHLTLDDEPGAHRPSDVTTYGRFDPRSRSRT